jgi:hypothetical protein
LKPGRSWQKKIGRPIRAKINRATIIKTGEIARRPGIVKAKSSSRFLISMAQAL